MNNVEQEILSIRLTFIFNFYTQTELGEILKIGQWKLLEKMRDKSFTKEELLKIEEVCDELKNK
ncbi:hypothetical protein [Flavobacterium sp.]|uniref:hypothetical protein n=1 Tax=Flavobacterium sp. TaxID=239 RepID=UPI0038FBF3CC